MSLPVLVAVTGAWEAPLVAGLERTGSPVRVARRCADLSELLSAAASGLARAAVVSADLPRFDADAVARLHADGVGLVGLVDPAEPRAAARLTAIGVEVVLDADATPAEIADALATAPVPAVGAPSGDGPGPGGRLGPLPANGFGRDLGAVPVSAAVGGPDDGSASAARRPGTIVAVWGPVGAPGRTTVAVTLAAELAALERSVLLVDADTYGPSVAQVLGLLDESAGIAAAVRAALQGNLDPVRLARLAPLAVQRLRVLTGLPRPDRWPELRTAGLDLLWEQARAVAAWTVVDCGFALEADEEITFDTVAPRRNGATLSALAAADVVLAVGAADPVGLQRLVRGVQELADVLPPGRRPRVVVTRVRASAVGASPGRRVSDTLQRYAGVRDPVLVPDDRDACDAALLVGRSLTEEVPSSPARRALAGLARDLLALEPDPDAVPDGRRPPRGRRRAALA